MESASLSPFIIVPIMAAAVSVRPRAAVAVRDSSCMRRASSTSPREYTAKARMVPLAAVARTTWSRFMLMTFMPSSNL